MTCRVVWRLTDPEVAVISAVAPTPGSVVSVALASPPLVRTEGVMEPVEDDNSTTVPLGTGWPSPSTTPAMTCTVLPQLMLAADRDRLILVDEATRDHEDDVVRRGARVSPERRCWRRSWPASEE